jgi:F0F1-type ATP synthase assembly protein I
MWELVGVGSAIAVLVAGGLLLGWVLDSSVGSFPLWTMVGLAVGIALACFSTYMAFRKFMKD